MTDYQDPRWQKLRLQVFERDKWRCVGCGDSTSTLVAHHKKYVGEIWESPLSDLQTLCMNCHEDLGRHQKGGVFWELDESGRTLHVTHCPWCASEHFKDKGGYCKCINCHWRSCEISSAVTFHCDVDEAEKTPVLFGRQIRSVYLAGKMADPWRDDLTSNGEMGWSCNNHGLHGLLQDEDDGSWSVVRNIVNVPNRPPIDLCGPYWDTSLDPWAGHGHAGLVARESPFAHACGSQGDWGAKYLTMARCRRAINRCDLFFAWINSMDAFGTLVEIGMAVRSKCKIVVAMGPNTSPDLWFACCLADGNVHASNALDAWVQMWGKYENESPLIRDVAKLLAVAKAECDRNKEAAHG